MKKIELIEKLESNEEFVENGINREFYWAYRTATENGLDMLNIDDFSIHADIEQLIENIERFEVEKFSISTQSTALMTILAEFKRLGYFPEDIKDVEVGTRYNFKEHRDEKRYKLGLIFKNKNIQ